MNAVLLFEEVQGGGTKPVRDFCQVLTVIFLLCLVMNLVWQKGRITELTLGLFSGLVLLVLVNIFLNVRLITQITPGGIYVRYAPFHPSFRFYPWYSIDQLYLRKYNALWEYRGWGYKQGPSGKAFTVSGDIGLQIVLKDQSKVLIGTNEAPEMANILRKMNWL